MKKKLSIILVLTCALNLVACGSNEKVVKDENSNKQENIEKKDQKDQKDNEIKFPLGSKENPAGVDEEVDAELISEKIENGLPNNSKYEKGKIKISVKDVEGSNLKAIPEGKEETSKFYVVVLTGYVGEDFKGYGGYIQHTGYVLDNNFNEVKIDGKNAQVRCLGNGKDWAKPGEEASLEYLIEVPKDSTEYIMKFNNRANQDLYFKVLK